LSRPLELELYDVPQCASCTEPLMASELRYTVHDSDKACHVVRSRFCTIQSLYRALERVYE
ncbi:MAG: hypothetical protein ACREIJ_02865, partial [Nitrospiraceae bacterium]